MGIVVSQKTRSLLTTEETNVSRVETTDAVNTDTNTIRNTRKALFVITMNTEITTKINLTPEEDSKQQDMPTPTKKSLTNKLDKLVSKIVRSHGKCERCGKRENLQCCHIFSRTYRSLRWSLDNLLCLCAGCHHWGHKNPILFTEFVREHLGEDNYELLKENYRAITKLTIQDLEIKLKVLEEMNEEHSSNR